MFFALESQDQLFRWGLQIFRTLGSFLLCSAPLWELHSLASLHPQLWLFNSWGLLGTPGLSLPKLRPEAIIRLISFISFLWRMILHCSLMCNVWKLLLDIVSRLFRQEGVSFLLPQSYEVAVFPFDWWSHFDHLLNCYTHNRFYFWSTKLTSKPQHHAVLIPETLVRICCES